MTLNIDNKGLRSIVSEFDLLFIDNYLIQEKDPYVHHLPLRVDYTYIKLLIRKFSLLRFFYSPS